MVIDALVAFVRFIAAAVRVYPPAAFKIKLLNVALPFTAVAIVIPLIPAGVELIVN